MMMSSKEVIYRFSVDRFPLQAVITEVGLRDGLQAESQVLPTEIKLELISDLIDAGIKHIQVVSLVNPRKIPSMADAQQLIARLPYRQGVVFSGLALNTRGVERAFQYGLRDIEISISASNSHSQRNTGMSCQQAVEEARSMINVVRNQSGRIYISLQCAFGCPEEPEEPMKRLEGMLVSLLGNFPPDDLAQIKLADTAGLANPFSVKAVLESITPKFDKPLIALHFHDTRGLGLLNVLTALEYGISAFDTALGGMGGCPFLKGASGNIATEDTVNMLNIFNVQTGIDIQPIAYWVKRLENFFHKKFPGKMHIYLTKDDKNG